MKPPPIALPVDLSRNRAPWDLRTRIARGLWEAARLLLFRPTPRRLGNPWRIALLRLFGARVAPHVLIFPSCRILQPWEFEIAEWSTLGEQTDVYNFARVTVGRHTVVSQRCVLCTGTHDYNRPDFPLVWKPIVLGDCVWLADGVFVHPGVTVPDGAVVGARSVVTRDPPAWTVSAGNPCAPIKPRARPGPPGA